MKFLLFIFKSNLKLHFLMKYKTVYFNKIFKKYAFIKRHCI